MNAERRTQERTYTYNSSPISTSTATATAADTSGGGIAAYMPVRSLDPHGDDTPHVMAAGGRVLIWV
jgi:hypothetical protein